MTPQTEVNKALTFHRRSILDKSINSLVGIVEGITIDRQINASELRFLTTWLAEHQELQDRHPYSELVPVVRDALIDNVLSESEQRDILWLCERLQSDQYYDETTGGLQRLHAVLAGIAADGIVTLDEMRGLSDWCARHEHLRSRWPFDEVSSLITAVLKDGRIDDGEQKMLKEFFTEFSSFLDNRTIVTPHAIENGTVKGVCATCPEIHFIGHVFCFTGASSRFTRPALAETVARLGGHFVKNLSAKVHYLVIGADGNPCWAYACYGRKIEEAIALRKTGVPLMLVHEHDFHDAVADA